MTTKKDGLREIISEQVCNDCIPYVNSEMIIDSLEKQIRSWAAGEMRKVMLKDTVTEIEIPVIVEIIRNIDKFEKGEVDGL
jgi:hypothetical protein